VTSTTFLATIRPDGEMSSIALPFDPRAVFGKARPAVTASLNGYSYRTTVFDMGHGPFIPLRKSHREAAGVLGGQTVEVTLTLDTEARTVTPPDDLVAALKAATGAWEGWQALSYTTQREHAEGIEQARRPETRLKRLSLAVAAAQSRAAKR